MATAIKELPDNATTEDIQEYVDQLLTDNPQPSEDEGGQPKDVGDKADVKGKATKKATKKATEKADNETKETSAGKEDAGDDSASENQSDSEDQGDEKAVPPESDWRDDDDVRTLAATVGITDEELSEFITREELDRSVRFMDRAALKLGREAKGKDGAEQKPDKEAAEDKSRNADGTFKKKESAEKEAKESAAATSGTYKVQLDPEEFDEGIIKEFDSLRNHYETRLEAMDRRFAAMEQAEQERVQAHEQEQFDRLVDSLGHNGLFGESGHETQEQLDNRQKLYSEWEAYQVGLMTLGRKANRNKDTADRLVRMVFSDYVSKQERKKLTKKLSRQSERRMGGGAVKPTETQEPVMQ